MVGRLVTVGLPAGAVASVAWAGGGYFPRTWGIALLVVAIAIASVAILADRVEPDRRGLAVVGSLLGLAVWQAVSRGWATAPDAAILEAERTLVYAGAAAAALLAVARARAADLVLGVLAGTTVATVGGLVEHTVAAGVPGDRLDLPVGYTNAAGILATTTILLGLGLTTGGPRWRAAAGAAVAVPATATLYLSLSRGSVVVAALGLGVLVAAARSAGIGRLALVAVPCGAATLVAARLGEFGDPGLSGAELGSLAALVLLSLAAAALVLRPPRVRVPRVPRRVVVAVGVVLAAGLALAAVREVRDVRATPAAQQGAPDRLLSTSTSSRGDYWDVALEMVAREPVLGEGAGGFERAWLRERPALLFARDAHNGYLETLAELGPLGLALLVVALGAPLLAARAASADVAGRAALAAYVALLLHVVLDWDLELPAVTLCTILLGVALVRLTGPGTAAPLRAPARASLLAAAVAVGLAAIVVHAANTAVEDAHRALDHGDVGQARAAADRARRFAPWAAEPWRLLGEAELAAGRLPLARERLRRAAEEDPRAWQTWLALAFAAESDERAAALARVRALNPLAPELEAFPAEDDPSKG